MKKHRKNGPMEKTETKIKETNAYTKLLAAVERGEKEAPGFHDYRGKLDWILDRAAHYAEKTGLAAADILTAWEARRDYWYMNYYQDAKQPEIDGDKVRVYETLADLMGAVGGAGYRCPACGGVSTGPYRCDTGIVREGEPCDWKAYGLFGTLGEGVTVFVKSEMIAESIFMPVAFETEDTTKQRINTA